MTTDELKDAVRQYAQERDQRWRCATIIFYDAEDEMGEAHVVRPITPPDPAPRQEP